MHEGLVAPEGDPVESAFEEEPVPTRSLGREEVVTNLLAGLTTSFAAIALGAAFGDSSGRGALVGILSAGVIALVTGLLGGTRVQCSGPTAPMTTVTTVIVTYSRTELLHAGTLSPSSWGGVTPANCTMFSAVQDMDVELDESACLLPDHFVNIVMVLGSVLIFLMGILRIGQYIALVPNVVISGFMNGIAVQIWYKQSKKLIGFGGLAAMLGSKYLNWPVAFGTTALAFKLPVLMRKWLPPKIAKSMPSTLVAIFIMTLVCMPLRDCGGSDPVDAMNCLEKTKLGATIGSFGDLQSLVAEQIPGPSLWSIEIIWVALPFALQLALLCYLDTLLTSLVVDKMVQLRDNSTEETNKSKELMAQGLANGVCAMFGGLPGAQATIRSVLILKEGGTLRLAGSVAGAFVIVEMLVFQHLVKLIPQAVFCGVLLKVGYDVFDFEPFMIYLRLSIEAELDKRRTPETLKARYFAALAVLESSAGQEPTGAPQPLQLKVARYRMALEAKGVDVFTCDDATREAELTKLDERVEPAFLKKVLEKTTSALMAAGKGASKKLVDATKPLPTVGHLEMFFIGATTLVTVAVNLNAAVGVFTLLFHFLKRKYGPVVIRDLSTEETKYAAGDIEIDVDGTGS